MLSDIHARSGDNENHNPTYTVFLGGGGGEGNQVDKDFCRQRA